MPITVVTYARLRALAKYENERLEMTAEVGPDEDPRLVYQHVRGLVHRLLSIPSADRSRDSEEFDDADSGREANS